MKGENQALLLEKLMKQKKIHHRLSPMLPVFMLKKESLAKLTDNDILLLGYKSLVLQIENENLYATLKINKLDTTFELEVDIMKKNLFTLNNDHKYETIKAVFSKIIIDKLDFGNKTKIESSMLEYLDIITQQGIKIAEGKLVVIDNKLAIEIKKVLL